MSWLPDTDRATSRGPANHRLHPREDSRASVHSQPAARHRHLDYHGDAMATAKVTVDGGHTMTASITREAVEDLALAEGTKVTVLVKSTEVMLGIE